MPLHCMPKSKKCRKVCYTHHPKMRCNDVDIHAGWTSLMPRDRKPQNDLNDESKSSDVGFGSRLILFFTSCLNLAQFALRKFHLFTLLLGTGVSRFAGMMSEGLS